MKIILCLISNLRLIPNQITAVRFFAVPVIWVCAFHGQLIWIGIGLIISLISDLLDGAVARKLNQTSQFGSKFDSLADQFLQLSSLIWVLMLMPEIFSENLFISLLAIIIYITSLLVGLVKFKRIADLHLYLSKFGGLFLYIFLIHAFIFGEYSLFLFMIAGILFILSSAETLILQLTMPRVDSNIGSILFRFIEADHPIRYWLSRLP
jgi:phosphatidylglycerophosphate synthase